MGHHNGRTRDRHYHCVILRRRASPPQQRQSRKGVRAGTCNHSGECACCPKQTPSATTMQLTPSLPHGCMAAPTQTFSFSMPAAPPLIYSSLQRIHQVTDLPPQHLATVAKWMATEAAAALCQELPSNMWRAALQLLFDVLQQLLAVRPASAWLPYQSMSY